MKCSRYDIENKDGAKFGRSYGHELNQMFLCFIEYKAILVGVINSIAGDIIIIPTQPIFHAHSFNVGNLKTEYLKLRIL